VGSAEAMNVSRDDGKGAGAADAPVRLRLQPERGSVRQARTFVADQCLVFGLRGQRCDDALLLASELVTNAVLHGRSEIALEMSRRGAVVRVCVVDENSRRPAQVQQDVDALDGRGLALVASLALRWGVEDRPLGKAVWFELSAS
jgi:anti-sigma regulatory factor (Ser/Thr protein kinase)